MSIYQLLKQWLYLTGCVALLALIIAYTGFWVYVILTRHLDFVIGMAVICTAILIYQKIKEL